MTIVMILPRRRKQMVVAVIMTRNILYGDCADIGSVGVVDAVAVGMFVDLA